jgi:hypothetical protein
MQCVETRLHRLRKNSIQSLKASGHDFSRADKAHRINTDLAPVGCFRGFCPDSGLFPQPVQSRPDTINLNTAVENVGQRQGLDSVAPCTAPQLTKMVKSSMFVALFGLKQLAILTALQLPFLG